MPRSPRLRLQWNPTTVAKLMADNGIGSRHGLSERLDVTRSTVYDAFDADWSGRATDKMIAQLMVHLGADFGDLIAKPKSGRKPGQKAAKS